ncbi:hypothetical protein FJ251_06745 [bacterium]|nr:hypothetical protein [bacterium]
MPQRPIWLALGLLFLAGAPLAAESKAVGHAEALRAGQIWLAARQSQGEAVGHRILGCLLWADKGRLLGWRLPLAPQGHLLVSAARELPPIKAFSFDTDLDPTATGGCAALLRETLGLTQALLAERGAPAPGLDPAADRARAAWAALLAGEAPAARESAVGPLVLSNWHQGAPFNNDCPEGDGGTCVVGCVATSAAMILKYWNYPSYGSGSHSYYWGGDGSCGGQAGGGLLQAEFGDAYDWGSILVSYSSGYTAQQAAAAAELNYEVGVAFEMDYGVCASGSYVELGAQVYPSYFRCAATTEFINRSQHTADSWWAHIRAELDALPPRPMHYRITSHSIICDGYQEEAGARYYHMNYGWGGSQSLWYALDEVYCPWSGCDHLAEGMVIGIEPLGYFTVSAPPAGAIWTHGEPMTTVTWSGASGASVVLDLYADTQFVARLADWTANDGQETPAGPVDPAWGTGGDFRIKVVGDDGRFAWSPRFGIFGGGAWSDLSTAPVADPGNGQAVAWGDAGGDGRPDLYLSNSGSPNRLFTNLGDGNFASSGAPPIDVSGFSRGAAWADIDNDGDLDLALARTGGQGSLLFRNEGGTFADITPAPLAPSQYTSDLAWGDYDGDGLIDLYLVNAYIADRLLRNVGDGSFADATAPPLGDSGWGRSAEWVDADGDGDLDLHLVRHSADIFYRNEGGGSFSDQTAAAGLGDAGNGFGAAWGDCDNDGDLDVYVVNDGANRLYRNEGGHFANMTAAPLDDAGAGRGAAWADYDGDGWLDLYLVNNGASRLFRNLGGGAFADATHPVLGGEGAGTGAAWADFDADGDLDLYVAYSDRANRLLRNDTAGGHWLSVDLVGTASNRLGLGARVTAVAGALRVTRALGGDAGYLSQNAPTLHFGLGAASGVDSLLIRWPSGILQRLTALAADQHLLVSEGSTPVGEAPATFALLPAQPNPFNPSTTIRFALDSPARVDLDVLDCSGRCQRRLLAGASRPAGSQAVVWDGRDGEGRLLASGLYIIRLQTGGRAASQKLVLLK